ncbi:helicase-related protein [Aminobacterium colombiense]|jgi:superfamily II DNA or RNA helicase|uniref:Helicase domain protein n=1 Tax=Aminobacterium colombiense (strain DSM 12261 / ALA-1) TaxID=572547 RepID=D5EFX2_AMICL|nr:helicase-related protein [Aminobacterium colombiense]ADE57454.1 helicase domain protein [Aminobacterium colombiense DSM 12261]MDD2379672.1 helicase-related protein [Aminobacterium colombiense]MDD3768623.1 helicase-related protein [Aminobacterium colombiense]MDD4266051.1 helicase-related protein [Aminobacterium colombiense]MDD4586634.1 helicase-related protein [Aminobacterium colombiense]
MSTDLSFITNEENQNLKERFKILIKSTDFFDCLVGYFYSSGFHAIYPSLEDTQKIRILIGISTNRETFNVMEEANKATQQLFDFSHAETKQEVENLVLAEMEESEDNRNVEEGVHKFIEWIKTGKLEIRAYPSKKIHAKLYIMTFSEDDRDRGRVITGSSNFTQAGLVDNLEFNVELKNRSDYEFAKNKFDKLWADAVDVSEKYVQTIQDKTWLTQNVTPYELYLKFLYEYFKDELSQTDEVFVRYLPQEFKRLEYQEQAVLNAKKIVLEYGGVFISDVVGLGKTYISAMLAGQLDGRTLVIAPPVLLEKTNPGSWPNVFSDFRVPADYESIGRLDNLIERGTEKYTNIIIDEAHRFRTETTITYEKLAEICRGKRVILVTATPYNNSPKDILSLLKLFQKGQKSTIPNLPNLESFFNSLDKKLKQLDRKKDYDKYIETVKENAREIRNKVLKYLMVRRTRAEIEEYFSRDIKEQGLKFPKVAKPVPLFYELNEKEDFIFNRTIEHIANQFKYARYMPMLYYKNELNQLERQSQRNMGRFMKILLVKRLESSFFAFRNTGQRFLNSYNMFLKELDDGFIYVSKKYSNKIFELLESDDDEALQKLIDEGKAERYSSEDFKDELRTDLEHDRAILMEIKRLWEQIDRDPKLLKFKKELSTNATLQKNHLIIFTESKETANYLFEEINKEYPKKVLLFTGDSKEAVRDKVIANFDARARSKKGDYRILISTEVLSEGVNLHRSNVVVNYDIPWNPTRMMQRVGRINRVDTPFDVIHTFNFFPTTQSNDQIKLKEAAEGKINAFLTLLGGDAELLTEGEPIGSHELFDRLTSAKTLEGNDESEESELKYLRVIQDIREKNAELFERIKRLPKKARTSKQKFESAGSLITYFRLGKLQKFFMSKDKDEAQELDFMTAAKLLESNPEEKRKHIPGEIYDLLDKNKNAFIVATTEEVTKPQRGKGKDSAANILKILKATMSNTQKFTEDQEDYLRKVFTQLEEGGLPKQTTKNTLQALQSLRKELVNPLKVLAVLQANVPAGLLESHYAEQNPAASGKREVILSLYLAGEKE